MPSARREKRAAEKSSKGGCVMHRTIQELSDDIKAGKERIYTLHELNEKNKELKAEAEQLRKENDEIKELKAENREWIAIYDNLQKENEQLRKDLRIASTQRDVQQDCNKNWIKRYDELKTESDKFRKARDTLEGHLGYSESKNRGLNVQCIDFADKIHELKAEAEQLKKQNRNMINVLNDENDLLLENEQLKADLKIANKNWIKRYDELKTESNKSEEDNEKLRNTGFEYLYIEMTDKNKELKEENKQLEAKIDNAIEINAMAIKDNKQLGAKIDELKGCNREWITMYEKLEEEAEQLKKENEESGYTCATLKREFVNTCSELRAENDRLISNHVWKLTDRCAELKKANNEMGDMCAELRAENSKLEAELKELKGGDSD